MTPHNAPPTASDREAPAEGSDGTLPVASVAAPATIKGRKPAKRGTAASGSRSRRASGAAARSAPLATKTAPIIVATADPSMARMLSFALDQMRLSYRLLESGSETLRELQTMKIGSHPPIVVLDVDLPGVDGHAILERIGVDRPDTFLILVLSSHADESVQVRSLLAGALDHLAKPFNVRILMAKIQRWVTMAAHLAGAA